LIRIGFILFAIGLLLISPIDEIFILIPLSAMVGMWVFPVFFIISIACLIVGGLLIGRHILPYLENPLVMISALLSVGIMIYLLVTSGWLNPFLESI